MNNEYVIVAPVLFQTSAGGLINDFWRDRKKSLF